jgi:hypothetical protein
MMSSHAKSPSYVTPEYELYRRYILTSLKYTLRFRETVFVQNLLDDDRFSNVSESYLRRNPEGKAVICIPIVHSDRLLGSIYVEGPPNSFTERNTQVIRLLVGQISISLSNAMLFAEVERVSASNEAMLEMQKCALAQARAAEIKAKEAEANAVRNMKLKEEAAKAKSLFLANVSHELVSTSPLLAHTNGNYGCFNAQRESEEASTDSYAGKALAMRIRLFQPLFISVVLMRHTLLTRSSVRLSTVSLACLNY